MKTLNYVRSLVAHYIPKRSFQPAEFSKAPSSSRQSLPAFSSLLSKSFSLQLNPGNAINSAEENERYAISVLNSSTSDKVNGLEDFEFILYDVFTWRWHGHQQSLVSPGRYIINLGFMSGLRLTTAFFARNLM